MFEASDGLLLAFDHVLTVVNRSRLLNLVKKFLPKFRLERQNHSELDLIGHKDE